MTSAIDPLQLLSVLSASLAAGPEITAVYIALAESGEVLYVGVARNRRERWQGHHHWHVLQVSQCTKIICFACAYDASPFIEAAMIVRHKPLFHGRGRAGRPLGKSSNPHFERRTVLVTKQTRKTAQRLWVDGEPGKDMSDVLEQRMVDSIVAQSA
jgi:excinuclease UvrABC nuclease subunit